MSAAHVAEARRHVAAEHASVSERNLGASMAASALVSRDGGAAGGRARSGAVYSGFLVNARARGGLAARGGGGALGTLGGTCAHGWSRGSVARVDRSGRENLGGKGEKFLATLGITVRSLGRF